MRQKYKGEDIKSRLHGTVIRYKNHPYLAEVDSSGLIGLRNLETNNLDLNVHADDEFIDISSISVGYVNIMDIDHKFAVYLKREPLRRYKQGVVIGELTQVPLGGKFLNHNVITSRGFVDATLGRFPSFNEALNRISNSGWRSVAISRDIALKREENLLKVYIKDSEVGYIRLVELKAGAKVYIPKTETSYYYKYLLEQIKDWTVVEGK